LAISLPLGIVASRRPRLAELVQGAASVIQTVPSLALLALLVPLLGGMIGFVPAFVALTLYSVLPILVNTIVGIRQVDPVLLEAARGLGMSDRQMLWRVQLPLAAPKILAGIRTATVLVVGTATLATPVGQTTLGNYIFVGLETLDHLSIVFGCLFAALLAVALDQLIRLLEQAVRHPSRRLDLLALAGLLLVLLGGLYQPLMRLLTPAAQVACVGSAGFTEQHILSEVLREQLQAHGFEVEQRRGMGKMIQFEALRRNQIDCCVDYSGSLWAVVLQEKEVKNRDIILDRITTDLRQQYGIVCLGALGFENAFALAMRRARAEELGIKDIDDLARHAGDLKVAGDLQFFSRPEWVQVRDTYQLGFQEIKPMDASLMYAAVGSGGVDVISAYTTDGRIDSYDLVLLKDPRAAFLPYDAVILVSPAASHKPKLLAALKSLNGTIKEEEMRRANHRVDMDKHRPRQAAAELLQSLGLPQHFFP
jgi:osmoprotectant transport system permease protein